MQLKPITRKPFIRAAVEFTFMAALAGAMAYVTTKSETASKARHPLQHEQPLAEPARK